MRKGLGGLAALALAAAAVTAAATTAIGSSNRADPAAATRPPSHPFEMALSDPIIDAGGPNAAVALRRARAAGANLIRINFYWNLVVKAKSGNLADPANRAYSWAHYDEIVKRAVANHLTPYLSIQTAPSWAHKYPDGLTPDASDLGDFVRAAARHYSGSYRGVPRVRYWMIWNEPNLLWYLTPQYDNDLAVAAVDYRAMLNAAYKAVHGVRRDNVLIAGGLVTHVQGSIPPLVFMRTLMCVEPACDDKASFDAFSVHPYTFGGPTHLPATADDFALGNLGIVPRMLRDQQQRGEVVSRGPVQFWITEFSYDSNPPDKNTLPFSLQTRWADQAFYDMWRNGANVVTWFLVRDQPLSTPWQSGLYFAGKTIKADRPKPTLRAFRFPFVALVDTGGTTLWGRTPFGKTGAVVVQKRVRGSWKTVMKLRTDRYGIFYRRLASRSTRGEMRAVLADRSDQSLPFGLKPVADRHIAPWG